MENQISQCPLISAKEYDNCYFMIHRAYSHFFGNINDKNEESKFKYENFKKIAEKLEKFHFSDFNERNKLINKFDYLSGFKDNNSFIENSIKAYTGESNFCYLFNRIMRNFEKGLVSFAYYMGPFLYGINKYVKEKPKFAISKSIKLYRIIQCSDIDFYLYKLNLGHIVCFPSLTSTSSKPIKFKPSKLSQKTNYNNDQGKDMVKINMIFKYKHSKGSISPGIIIEDKKLDDGSYLSANPKEKEVLLFPFTFAKIKKIYKEKEIQIIKLEIINRYSYIEYDLRDNLDKRILFSKYEDN